MNIVSYPRKFYSESGSMLGLLYEEGTGYRLDWGKVEMALENGEPITIRQCNDSEYKAMSEKLAQIKKESNDGTK